MGDGFLDKVTAAVRAHGPLCAGIDPSGALLADWGLTDDAAGLRAFCDVCVEAFAGAVAVVKPQVAFFERHGAAGLAELERLIAEARSAGLVVIADAKRGDIDSTADAYADAWLSESSPLAADAVTAHAYLGLAALEPLVRRAGDDRAGGPGGGPQLQSRGTEPPARHHRGRAGGRGHAPGRDCRPERLRRGADGCRRGGCRSHPRPRQSSHCPSSEG